MDGRNYAKIPTRRFPGKHARGIFAFLTVIFAFVLGGAASLALLPHQEQQSADAASATLTGNPLGGGPGTQVALSGKGFGASEAVKIYWNYAGPGTGTLLTSSMSNSNGRVATNIVVPGGTSPGAFIPIVGVGQSSNITATFNFYLYAPTLDLAPLNGSAAIGLTVSAAGFQGLENVNIYWNGGSTPILTATTTAFGYLAPATFTVPPGSSPGSYQVKAVGQASNISISNTYTVVSASSTLNLTAGPVGVTVGVSGGGYAANETVNIIWNYTGPGTGSTVATAVAGFGGNISTSFSVPASATGQYNVAALGSTSGRISQNTFSVADGLASSPATTPPGTTVTVSGSGYTPGEAVKVYWNSTSGTLLATTNADANGTIVQAVATPSSAQPGAASIVGQGQSSGVSFTAPLTINTSWGDFGFNLAHTRQNPYENTVGTSTVANLTLKWSASTAAQLQASPVYANGTVYLGTFNGILNAYDATTGHVKWSFNSGTGFQHASAPLYDPATNTVFFGTVGTRDALSIPAPLFALDAATGTLKWSLWLPWNLFGFPTLSGTTLYLGISHATTTSGLDAIDTASGHIDWQYTTGGGVWGAVAVDASAHMIFTGVGDPVNQLVALNPATGVPIWQYTVPHFHGDDDPCSGIDVANGLVYVNSKNGSVYAIHESNGSFAWSTSLGPVSSGNVSSPAVANGTLYVGSHDQNLYTIDASTGSVLRKTLVGGGIQSSPAVANGVVYFASLDGKFYAMDASSGKILWSFTSGGKSYCSPVMANGWLYCSSTDGKLYAFSL
jgi:outer membrane protein assembly factor BamB